MPATSIQSPPFRSVFDVMPGYYWARRAFDHKWGIVRVSKDEWLGTRQHFTVWEMGTEIDRQLRDFDEYRGPIPFIGDSDGAMFTRDAND